MKFGVKNDERSLCPRTANRGVDPATHHNGMLVGESNPSNLGQVVHVCPEGDILSTLRAQAV